MRPARRPLAIALCLAFLAALFGSGVCAAASRRCCCKPPAATVALCKASCCVKRAAEQARAPERAEAPHLESAELPVLASALAPPVGARLVFVDHAPPARIGDGPAFRLRV